MAENEDVLNSLDILSCCLIGDYDDNGNYVVSDEIKKDLLYCTKVATEYTETYLDCQALVGTYTIKFRVKFLVDDEELKHGGIYLIEKYKILNKSYSEETFIAEYSDFDDNYFLDKIRQVFNIATKDESTGKDIVNKIPSVEEIKDDKKALYKRITQGMADANKRYVIEVLMVLKASVGLGNEMRQKFKDRISKIKTTKGSAFYWADVKSELDLLIEEYKERYDEETEKLLKEARDRYMLIYQEAEKVAKKKKEALKKKKKKKKKSKDVDGYKPHYPKVKFTGKPIKINLDSFKFNEIEIPYIEKVSKKSKKLKSPVKLPEQKTETTSKKIVHSLDILATSTSCMLGDEFSKTKDVRVGDSFMNMDDPNKNLTNKILPGDEIVL